MTDFKPDAQATRRVRDELERLQGGDRKALDALLPLLFQQLRRVARAQRGRYGGGETLRTTALIHEAYLKLRRSDQLAITSEEHFLHLAARAMRQILVDHARSRLAAQRRDEQAGDDVAQSQLGRQARILIDVDTALRRLEPDQPRLVQIVNCRCFGGYTERETSNMLGVSERTVRRDWLKVKSWLLQELGNHDAV